MYTLYIDVLYTPNLSAVFYSWDLQLRCGVWHFINYSIQVNVITNRIKGWYKSKDGLKWSGWERSWTECCRKISYIFPTFHSSQLASRISDVVLSRVCLLISKSWLEWERRGDGDWDSNLFARKDRPCGQLTNGWQDFGFLLLWLSFQVDSLWVLCSVRAEFIWPILLY